MDNREKESDSGESKSAKEKLYDKIPVTYRQVDIFVKALIVVLAVVLMIAIVKGGA